jgi:tRNA A58 N-methylase Trm61
VDLTVGNGKDTLFLWNAVGPHGCVIGFDIQMEALENAEALVRKECAEVNVYPDASSPVHKEHGIHLILANHSRWMDFVHRSPKAVIANLGYLPGSDHEIVTQIPTTIAALTAVLEGLSAGGLLVVVCYVKHPGGGVQRLKQLRDCFQDMERNIYEFCVSATTSPARRHFFWLRKRKHEIWHLILQGMRNEET